MAEVHHQIRSHCILFRNSEISWLEDLSGCWFQYPMIPHVEQQRANHWSYSDIWWGCHSDVTQIQIQWWPHWTLAAQLLFCQASYQPKSSSVWRLSVILNGLLKEDSKTISWMMQSRPGQNHLAPEKAAALYDCPWLWKPVADPSTVLSRSWTRSRLWRCVLLQRNYRKRMASAH